MTACDGKECLSHGLSETVGWYNGAHNMFSAEYPWFGRGGSYEDTTFVGVFSFYYITVTGGSSSYGSFRLVALIK